MNRELKQMKDHLADMAENETYKLWRMARNLIKRGGSWETVNAIREEANWLYDIARAYPERLIMLDAENKFKYAFK